MASGVSLGSEQGALEIHILKTLTQALIAASFLLSSTHSCFAQGAVDSVTTKLEGQITAGSKEAVEPQQKGDSGAKIFDVLNAGSSPNITKAGITRKTASKVVSLGNFMFDLRGFDWSVEGADVALGEKLDYKSEMSREYAVRRKHDQRELDAICTIFQTGMASGLDNADRREKLLGVSHNKLVDLIGESNANQLIERFRQAAVETSSAMPDQSGEAAIWTVDEQQEKFKLIVESSIERDPQIKSIMTRLHKFNGRSKFARVSAKVVYTTLGLASFAPTFVAPAAEASLLAFMTATGGPEQDKLLREMYLCKCLESRYKTIHEEAHLAVTNAQVAALTGNKPLAACSMGLVERMAGSTTTDKVFSTVGGREVASKVIEEGSAQNLESEMGDVPADTLN